MKNLLILMLLFSCIPSFGSITPQYSTAGFYQLPNTNRRVFSMNNAWRFHKGDVAGAATSDFDDQAWQTATLPHGIEYLPVEASGGINYRGVVWYRKTFNTEKNSSGQKHFLHFEGIMGKSKIYLNGKLVKEQFGGYLPSIVDVSEALLWDKPNVIAVWADNSDDPDYPPGKPQSSLDFTYFGGIYRDVWLIRHNNTYITDANYENEVAGGGLLISFNNVSKKRTEIKIQTHIRNEKDTPFSGRVEYELRKLNGKKVSSGKQTIAIEKDAAATFNSSITVKKPALWTPQSPNLHHLQVRIYNSKNQLIDGLSRRIGIRSIEFKGEKGFWLNGKQYKEPLIGANRHQDFAVLGHALPNSFHWRDAKKLKDAGFNIVRNAHYTQDPSFMDTADELGLFVIVATPGWQFWNDNEIFGKRVYSDIKNMVRRDRNHPSVIFWEPILNETWYPEDFAANAKNIVEQEQPGAYAASDHHAKGGKIFSIQYGAPLSADEADPAVTYFTREWGDYVDDWNAQNSKSRIHRTWGETPMLRQAHWYASIIDNLWNSSPRHLGGCLWHPFDHQRGYHPDPFYGGAMDSFRQPKIAYEFFQSQRLRKPDSDLISDTGPYIHIAHEMTPFSSPEVEVMSNCDVVKLTVFENGKTYRKTTARDGYAHRQSMITFDNAFDFHAVKKLSGEERQAEVYMLAECEIDGKIVAKHKKSPARRPEKLILWLDNENVDLIADGSDKIVVVAAVVDKNGSIKRLNNHHVKFEIEGQGRLIGNSDLRLNPKPVEWGSAPILVESTTTAGEILVKARVQFEGEQQIRSGEIRFSSVQPTQKALYTPVANENKPNDSGQNMETQSEAKLKQEILALKKALNRYKLKEVEQQQKEFEIKQ